MELFHLDLLKDNSAFSYLPETPPHKLHLSPDKVIQLEPSPPNRKQPTPLRFLPSQPRDK